MDDNQTGFVLYVLGFIGLIVLLGGAFSFYEFKYGLVGAIIIWFIAGAYRQYFNVPKK